MSKVATVDYLKSHFDEDAGLYKLYRYLDKLHDTQKDRVEQISVAHTRKILGGTIGLVFYDVTTLYFETDYGDELRKQGFSKDGKHASPQVVLGLLISEGAYRVLRTKYKYKVYKELERILKTEKMNISVDKVLEIAKTITTIRVRLPHSNTIMERTMLITAAHKSIARLFDENFWRRKSEAK